MVQLHDQIPAGRGELLRGRGIGPGGGLGRIAAVEGSVPQAVARSDQCVTLGFGQRLAPALVGDNAGRDAGQQRKALIRRREAGDQRIRIGLA